MLYLWHPLIVNNRQTSSILNFNSTQRNKQSKSMLHSSHILRFCNLGKHKTTQRMCYVSYSDCFGYYNKSC